MLKQASEMSVEELRAEVEKIEAQRAKRRAYSQSRRTALTDEQKAKRRAYGKDYRARQQEVIARAQEVGATGGAPPQATTTQQPAQPKPKRRKK